MIRAPFFPEEMRVVHAEAFGNGWRLATVGSRSGRYDERILTPEQVAQVEEIRGLDTFQGDPHLFLLGAEALRLGLAHEYDPYFALSVSRVDPLPHQLEAVYQYFLTLPRIRFLLADDPGAGKTIMAGLLLRELKARGLVRRILVVTPANLMFQWQRELQEKFRETFTIVRGEALRAVYGRNPWQEHDQVITSLSWISRIEEARDSLLRAGHWDLVIVDEAHKMSAQSRDKKTLAYQIGEALSERSDHLLLMTATPHKGDPVNFCLFLELLDKDVYGDVKSLEEAMRRNRAPFYLRRTKEALITFPDPDTGEVRKLFTKREVKTVPFELTQAEMDFYEELRRYVEEQSMAAAEEDTPPARVLRFTMAMLQRRFASSVYACRKSLERMRERRQKVLEDPERYLREQQRRAWDLPEDMDDWPEEEREAFERELEAVVLRFDPASLRREIARLDGLIARARDLEAQGAESKLERLQRLVTDQGLFGDPTMKLLVFTEHKDTLDYLAGDGREGRPLGWLRRWGLAVSTIHGGMKVGDRDTPGTRLYAEREFRESSQVLVATEAAGEGINLQFCWLLVNYDIPWSPVRLEQRMGRIHRYGQERDVLAFNFVAHGTLEGRVLQKLLDRLEAIRQDLGDSVFDVVGEVFPGNQLERMMRDLYARKTTLQAIEARIVQDVHPERFRAITQSALEGLAVRELNLAAIVRQRAEMKERRLVPEVVERFFLDAAPRVGLAPRAVGKESHVYRVGRLPRSLLARGQELEGRYGHLGHEYGRVAFDKALLKSEPTLEWVTPGHPLFEAVRAEVEVQSREALRAGAVLYDPEGGPARRLDVFVGSVVDGDGATVHRRLFVVEAGPDGQLALREPTVLLDLVPAPGATPLPGNGYATVEAAEAYLLKAALGPLQREVAAAREQETDRVQRHVELSLGALIERANLRLLELTERQVNEPEAPGLAGQLAQAEQHLQDLLRRKEVALARLARQRACTVGELRRLGSAWVLPHPGAAEAAGAALVRDEAVERIAMEAVIAFERSQGWVPEDVHAQNRGFDILSRHPKTGQERAIEVKGCGGVDAVFLTRHEHETARKLGADYWLYVVYKCHCQPEIYCLQNPSQLPLESVQMIERWKIDPEVVRTPYRRQKA